MTAAEEIIELRKAVAELARRVGHNLDVAHFSASARAHVVITGGVGANAIGDVYANGRANPATETGVTIKVRYINAAENVGGFECGADYQDWSGTMYWTIDVPVLM